MTLEELKTNWRDYALEFNSDSETRANKDEYESCEEYGEWLLFRFRGGVLDGYIGDLFGVDENDNCIYGGVIMENEEPWEETPVIGKFVKLAPPEKSAE